MWPSAIVTMKTIDLESTHVKCNHKLKEVTKCASLSLDLKISCANILTH